MPVEPLILAIDEIRSARDHEYRRGHNPDYLAAAHHCNQAIELISKAINKTQLDTNREKLHRKCERLSKKVDQLKSNHDSRERKRWEAIRNEEAKTRFHVVTPYKEVYDEEWLESEQTRIESEENVGLKEELQNILEVLSLPLNPRKYISGKSKSAEPLLIYGPKNVGKSYLVEKVLPVYFPEAAFVRIKPEDLQSHGDIVFEYAFTEAQKRIPSVIVLEDMQHPVYEVNENVNKQHHERLVKKMLNHPDVQVLGVTSAPWAMNPELLLRFPHKQLIDYPSEEEKTEVLKVKFEKFKHNLTPTSFDLLAQDMDDFLPNDVHLFVDKCEEKCERLNKLAEMNKQESGTEEEIAAFMRQFMFTLNTAKTILTSMKETMEDLPSMKQFIKFRQSTQNGEVM